MVMEIKHLPDGSIFQGQLNSKGIMHGKGKLLNSEGDIY